MAEWAERATRKVCEAQMCPERLGKSEAEAWREPAKGLATTGCRGG